MKKKVAVVIPIYKMRLSNLEMISLNQSIKILTNYDKFFVMPHSLKYIYQVNDIKEIKFENRWFENIQTYNELMLNSIFYKVFNEYDYILIYQLDAFVFEDKLRYFCDLGYDYIGAPWYSGLQYYVDSEHVIWHVGNGGLSLRNVHKCIKLLDDFSCPGFINEDLYFSMCDSENFRVAPMKVALEFSFETEVNKCFEANGYKLPFGCHAWWKYNLEFWKPYIEYFGYEIHDSDVAKGKGDLINIDLYVNRKKNSLFWEHIFDRVDFKRQIEKKGKKIYVWGAGKIGKLFGKLLSECLIDIEGYLDNNIELIGKYVESYKVLSIKDFERNRKNAYVIIAVNLFRNNISKQLDRSGCIYSRDYIFYTDIFETLIKNYFSKGIVKLI